jgi:hypothetical protein
MQIEIIIEVGTPYAYFHSKGFGQKSANNAQIKKISAKKNPKHRSSRTPQAQT